MKKVVFLLLILVSCADEKSKSVSFSTSDSKYFTAISANDVALSQPQFGDWRQQHIEKKQTFEDYVSDNPFIPDDDQKVIYLQPIGKFDSLQVKAIELTREYVEIFFQRKTVVLDAIPDAGIPAGSRRQNFGHEQLKTGYILHKILAPDIPDDAMAIMAISQKDLYPNEDWNYVFGQASYSKRVGVTSIFRLQDEYLGGSNFDVCVRRLANVSVHEIGHMLTIHHCLFAKCVMNGSNNLQETDAGPMRLCSDCQKKLKWNLGYDNSDRLKDLLGFSRKHLVGDVGELEKDMAVVGR
ncbi:MAG: Zn-dependent protease [Flavobacterium sp.]|uniref:archaemetzincin n=1 Tax=Flavobacterium sp. TaxID=239 RepID=UPI00120C441E|nr:archaemetzincin [Flavobacterium sp.]RZJ67018.1 MAG: Zn-dependent protease [Flavobacterium sp.]